MKCMMKQWGPAVALYKYVCMYVRMYKIPKCHDRSEIKNPAD